MKIWKRFIKNKQLYSSHENIMTAKQFLKCGEKKKIIINYYFFNIFFIIFFFFFKKIEFEVEIIDKFCFIDKKEVLLKMLLNDDLSQLDNFVFFVPKEISKTNSSPYVIKLLLQVNLKIQKKKKKIKNK